MGTPDFAVATLDKILAAGFNVVAVITAPDRPAGRGMQLQQSAVKKFAIEKKLRVLQPEKLKDPEFLEVLGSLKADLQVVVAFRMLPEVVWNMPPMGTLNLHASLLPQYRGAAPINWAIIRGEKETGVTTFKLKHEIDTGNILLQRSTPVGGEENAGQLHDRLKEIGADLMTETLKGLANEKLAERPQALLVKGQALQHAPKIFTEDCRIDWNKNVDDVYNLIRGLSPYPAAFTMLEGKTFKILAAEKRPSQPAVRPGAIDSDHKTFLHFACRDGWIEAREVQLEGKKKMGIADFLRGYHFT